MANYSALQTAQMASDFLDTPFGEYFMEQMGIIYNDFHQKAEGKDLNIESKAMLIERAAGIKEAIDFILTRKRNLEEGLLDKA
jgi:hypothetical protein